MDPSRLAELEELFERILARPPEERLAAVEELTGDPELRDALRELVASADDAADYFDDFGGRIAREVADELSGPAEPSPRDDIETLGLYRLVREVGSGGMGRVFLAYRYDDPDRETPLAIKLLRSEVLEPEILDRFDVERSFLAGIDHPNIARLLDAGTRRLPGPEPSSQQAEQPYFVMEYVDGQPIDRYCEEERLGLVDRIRLFRELCAAVHFLHQNLVVHRDIKPGNVLVDRDGVPKLLDFGIAKFLDPAGLRWKGDDTRAEVRLFTADYASPEQILGEPITTTTDVFSLGALLYLLLTGTRIRSVGSTSYPELVRAVTDAEPERPSTAVTRSPGSGPAATGMDSPGWAKRLRGDLDAILLKALRREPEERYGSAAELSEELRRYLDGEAVEARRGGWRYRALKFTRRHRLPIAAAALFLSSLVTFTGLTVRSQKRAETEARRAQEINRFLTEDLLEGADPRRQLGLDVTMKQVLDAARERVDGRFADDPLVEADIRRSLGATYRQLGDYESSEPELRRAVELRERELGELARPTIMALSNLADLLSDRAEYDEALRLQEETARRARLALDEGDSSRLSILNNLASLYSELGHVDRAEPIYSEVLDAQQRLLGVEHTSALVTATNLARLWGRTGREDEAERLLVETLERSRSALGPEHPYSFRIGTYLASHYTRTGRYAEAEALHRQNFEGQLETLGPEHPDTLMSRNNLAVALYRQERFGEAAPHFEEILSTRRRTLGEGHPSTLMSMHNLAGAHLELGEPAEAVALSREAVDNANRTFPEDHFNHAIFRSRLGIGLLELGQRDEAAELLNAARPILLDRWGPEHPAVVEVAAALADLGR